MNDLSIYIIYKSSSWSHFLTQPMPKLQTFIAWVSGDHPLNKSLIGTIHYIYNIHPSLDHDCSCAFIPSQQTQPSPSLGALRLCLHSLLCSADKFLATFAIKCASWSSVNRGTSYRTPCTSIGYEQYPSVTNSNMMAGRFLKSNS